MCVDMQVDVVTWKHRVERLALTNACNLLLDLCTKASKAFTNHDDYYRGLSPVRNV